MNGLSAVAGALLSLAMAYTPKLSQWYKQQNGTMKRLVMGGLIVLAAAASIIFGCVGVFERFATECNQVGIEDMLIAVVTALVTNQSMFLIAVKNDEVATV